MNSQIQQNIILPYLRSKPLSPYKQFNKNKYNLSCISPLPTTINKMKTLTKLDQIKQQYHSINFLVPIAKVPIQQPNYLEIFSRQYFQTDTSTTLTQLNNWMNFKKFYKPKEAEIMVQIVIDNFQKNKSQVEQQTQQVIFNERIEKFLGDSKIFRNPEYLLKYDAYSQLQKRIYFKDQK